MDTLIIIWFIIIPILFILNAWFFDYTLKNYEYSHPNDRKPITVGQLLVMLILAFSPVIGWVIGFLMFIIAIGIRIRKQRAFVKDNWNKLMNIELW